MFPQSESIFRTNGPMGIPVEVHKSLLGLVAIFAFIGMQGGSLVWISIQLAMLLVAIFLHELGHAWGARVQGVPVRRIVLHGGGGFCEYRSAASRTEQELIVAMGPLVNLTLWALASLGVWAISQVYINRLASEGPAALAQMDWLLQISLYLGLFARINLMLFIFNMIPVQPLDGGKLLQLALLRVMPPPRALRVTGAVGLVAAVLWIPAMIALYVFVGFILFFIPSIKQHLAMARGNLY